MCDKNYVSTPEAADILGLTRRRVSVLCLEGRFEGAFKVGDTWIIPRESVAKLVRYGPRGKGKLEAEIAQAVEEARARETQ